MKQIDIADLDCIYLSYDEPQQEEFWVKIKNMVPWAQRVSNIRGSDAAHKAAALASDTERFILVDGDNIPDPAFFNQTLDFPTPEHEKAVFRWRARNHVNGLMYGNGGLSSWTREHVINMKTHENTDGRDETVVEFCFDPCTGPCTTAILLPIPINHRSTPGVPDFVKVSKCVYSVVVDPHWRNLKNRYYAILTI
jgi:hypothetical protein